MGNRWLLGAGALLTALTTDAFAPMSGVRRAGRATRVPDVSFLSRPWQTSTKGAGRVLMATTGTTTKSARVDFSTGNADAPEGNSPGLSVQAEAELVASSTSTVFVAGGSGFVGSQICRQLVEEGCNVIALSRSGTPERGESWFKSVKWVQGNALNQDAYRTELRKSDSVVSCIGGFGKTDAYMGLVNGEANIKLAEAAADAGVKRFIFVSVHDYRAPGFVKKVGYFDGKRRAEKVVGELFGNQGIILRPALIYGERRVQLRGPDGKSRRFKIPLQRLGGPLARITSTDIGKKIAGSGLPLADVAWTQPISTTQVGKTVAQCCLDGTHGMGSRSNDSGDAVVLRVQDIVELAAA